MRQLLRLGKARKVETSGIQPCSRSTTDKERNNSEPGKSRTFGFIPQKTSNLMCRTNFLSFVTKIHKISSTAETMTKSALTWTSSEAASSVAAEANSSRMKIRRSKKIAWINFYNSMVCFKICCFPQKSSQIMWSEPVTLLRATWHLRLRVKFNRLQNRLDIFITVYMI